jgi:hypothetical protein
MSSMKQIDPAALASLTSGILLVPSFSPVHAAAEWVAGHPIWTHEFADRAFCERLRDAVLAHFPDMPTERPANWQETAGELRARLGETVAMPGGDWKRNADSITTLEALRAAKRGEASPA